MAAVEEGQADQTEKRVAPLELFFDLVFVFAVTQVTALMSHTPTWEGLGQGMLVLIALWWCWGAYAWLTNYIAADEGVERLLMFAVMGAILIAALAVPHAFGEHALLFGIAYAIARWLHIFIWAEANDDVDTGQAIARLSRTALPGPALLIAAGLVDDGTAASGALDSRAEHRLRGPVRVRRDRVPGVRRPLRGALLADRDHRPG